MKKWDWKMWAQWIVAGVILVAAVAGIIYGVATHEEPGLANPEARWDHAALTVTCAPYAGSESDACDTAEDVVSVVNSRLGYDALDWRGRRASGSDIEVVTRAPVEVGDDGPCGQPGECFVLTGSGGVYDHCAMQTMNVSGGAGNLEWLVIYHGLGHCLGLAHDNYGQSIMYPSRSSATPGRTIPPWISDFDRRVLRGLYAE